MRSSASTLITRTPYTLVSALIWMLHRSPMLIEPIGGTPASPSIVTPPRVAANEPETAGGVPKPSKASVTLPSVIAIVAGSSTVALAAIETPPREMPNVPDAAVPVASRRRPIHEHEASNAAERDTVRDVLPVAMPPFESAIRSWMKSAEPEFESPFSALLWTSFVFIEYVSDADS